MSMCPAWLVDQDDIHAIVVKASSACIEPHKGASWVKLFHLEGHTGLIGRILGGVTGPKGLGAAHTGLLN